MISFQAPLWLILLALLPPIRWLHRFRQQSRTYPSTTLFLWTNIQHHKNNDGTLSRPDPRWLLRALLTTLLILSLADPTLLTKDRPSIDVWLDDSLSMFTQEDEGQRIAIAVQQLQHYLRENKAAAIHIHSLGNPASVLELDPDDSSTWPDRLSEWTSRPRGEPSPPPPAALSPDSNHILVTDGADTALNAWAQSAPLQFAIQNGNKTQNIALTRLSLRQPLNESDNISGLVQIDNTGQSAQQARLILQQDEQIIEVQMLELPPSATIIRTFTLPALQQPALQQNRLVARLEAVNNTRPLDALTIDDRLQLATDRLRPPLRYEKRGACSRYVMAVLDTQPALVEDRKKPADVIIDCSGEDSNQDSNQGSESETPTLRFISPRSLARTTQAAHWHQNFTLEPVPMVAGLPYSNEAPPLNADAVPILSADGRLLILKQEESSQSIDCYLDTSDPVFARRPEYPLLILSLLATVSGRSLDMSPLSITRDIDASRITPFALPVLSAPPRQSQTTQTSFTPMLLFASLLVLLLDILLAAGLVNSLLHRFGKQDA